MQRLSPTSCPCWVRGEEKGRRGQLVGQIGSQEQSENKKTRAPTDPLACTFKPFTSTLFRTGQDGA